MAGPTLNRVLRHIRRIAGRPPGADTSDRHLLDRFAVHRDEGAFAALVHRHGPMVRAVCQRLLDQDADRDDAFQATFLVLLHKARSIRQRYSVGSWLYGVAYRTALKARASAARRHRHEKQPRAKTSADPDKEVLWREFSAILDEELHRLSEKYRAPLVLCYLEGQTQDQTANQLGWSLRTLKRRLEQGRELLRKRLTRRGLTLSTALLVAGLSQPEIAAAGSAGLAGATFKAATLVTVAKVAGPIPALPQLGEGMVGATALAQAVLKSMAVGKLRVAVVLALAAGIAVASAGIAAQRWINAEAQAAAPGAPKEPSAKILNQARPAEEQQTRTDRYGDPLPSGALLRLGTVRFRGDSFEGIVYSPDGKLLASGHWDGLIRIWDPSTGVILHTIPKPDDFLVSLAFSPDGQILASLGKETLYVWKVATGKEIRKISCPAFLAPGISLSGVDRYCAPLVFSPDGKTVASATKDYIVRLWDVATGQERLRLTGNERPVSCLAFTPDGKAIISAAGEQDKDGTIRKWDTATGKSLGTVRIPKAGEQNLDTSWPLAISPDCRSLAVDCWGGIPIKVNGQDGRRYPGYKIRLLDLATGKERCLLRGQEVPIDSVAFSPDSKLIALTDLNSKVVVCDVFSGRQRWEIQGYPSKLRGTQFFNLAFSPNGKTLASAESLNAIHFWDVSTGRELRANSAAHHSEITRVAYSPDGKMLATGSADQTVSLWDASTGQQLFKLQGHEGRISGLAFSPDSKMLAAFGNWHFVYLYDTATGKELHKFPVPDPQNGEELVGNVEPLALGFTTDGRYLVGVGIDKKLRRWEVATGKRFPPRRLQLSGMEGPPDFSKTIHATQLSPGAKTAALATPEGIYLVDVRSGKELFKLKASLFIVPMGALAFSADGRIVASGASNNEFLLWEVATGREITKVVRAGNTYSIAFPPHGRSIAAGIGSNQGIIHVVDTVTGKDLWKIKGDSNFVGTLAFSPDGKRLASGQRDSTVLIWDATAARDPGKLAEKDLSLKHLERLWTDLAGSDASKAYAAIWTLAAAPDETVNFMKDRLPPVPKVKPEHLRRLIAELDHEKFGVREEAGKQLTRLGIEAEPALRQALAGAKSLEVRRRIEAILASPEPPKVDSPERLRRLRAVQVLEQIGTLRAVKILEDLAEGALGAWETQEAQGALERLTMGHALKD